uniref:Protein E7 n=1 Tax=Human papillomavirus TaxID=10566 RepID=A0A386H7F4_9PAPI|nr:MAG: E7 protein [Human papillomavirus]
MIGEVVDIRDIELDLDSLVLPDNLLSNESLSPDSEGQEEEVEQRAFRIDSSCKSCGAGVRLFVFASRRAISSLQQLLNLELDLLCPSCGRLYFRDGRSR